MNFDEALMGIFMNGGDCDY